jgi:glucosylceramidase
MHLTQLKHRAAVLLAALAAVGVSAVLPAPAQARPASVTGPVRPNVRVADGAYLVQSSNGKCLEPQFGDIRNFVPVVLHDCTASASQTWTIISNDDGTVSLRNTKSGRCLDVLYGLTFDFVPTIQYDCHPGPIQHWTIGDFFGGTKVFTNQNSGKCLDVQYGFSGDSAPVQQFTCHFQNPQGWNLKPF